MPQNYRRLWGRFWCRERRRWVKKYLHLPCNLTHPSEHRWSVYGRWAERRDGQWTANSLPLVSEQMAVPHSSIIHHSFSGEAYRSLWVSAWAFVHTRLLGELTWRDFLRLSCTFLFSVLSNPKAPMKITRGLKYACLQKPFHIHLEENRGQFSKLWREVCE